MKQFLFLFSIAVLLLSSEFCFSSENELTMVTWNIRRKGSEKNRNFLWEQRKAAVSSFLHESNADIYCLQEVTAMQLIHLKEMLPGYEYVGKARKKFASSVWHGIGNRFAQNEMIPIFFKKDRFTLLDSGTFALGGDGWVPRICTWVALSCTQTDKVLYVFNVHLENNHKGARKSQLKNALKEIHAIVSRAVQADAIFLVGDFNAPDIEVVHRHVEKNSFINSKQLARNCIGDSEKTHVRFARNGVQAVKVDRACIDHIFVQNQSKIELLAHTTHNYQGSDHFPVSVQMRMANN